MAACRWCKEEIRDNAIICRHCHKRLVWWHLPHRPSLRILLGVTGLIVILILWWYRVELAAAIWTQPFSSYAWEAVIPEDATLRGLDLDPSEWSCGAPHIKGRKLHLRLRSESRQSNNRHAVVFLHGFFGNYLTTWGDIQSLINDDRLKGHYDFIFLGYKSFPDTSEPLEDSAFQLNAELEDLSRYFRSISLVTHSKGGVVALRALIDRYLVGGDRPQLPLHRIVLFAPPTVNVHAWGMKEWLSYFPEEEVKELTDETNSELHRVQADLSYLWEQDQTDAGRSRWATQILNKLFVVHGKRDHLVDAVETKPAGLDKDARVLKRVNSRLFAPGAANSDLYEQHYLELTSCNHVTICKAGQQDGIPFLEQFEEVLWSRLGSPPGPGAIDREQLKNNLREFVAARMYDLNQLAVHDPETGTVWKDIADAVDAQTRSTLFVSPDSDGRTSDRDEWSATDSDNSMLGKSLQEVMENLQAGVAKSVSTIGSILPPSKRTPKTKQTAYWHGNRSVGASLPPEVNRQLWLKRIYYIYLFLDIYSRMDVLRQEGILRADDSPLREWRDQWMPQLLTSEVGQWMVRTGLMGYYSAELQDEFEKYGRYSAVEVETLLNKAVVMLRSAQNEEQLMQILAEFRKFGSSWRNNYIYLYIIDSSGPAVFHADDASLEGGCFPHSTDLVERSFFYEAAQVAARFEQDQDHREVQRKLPEIPQDVSPLKIVPENGWLTYRIDPKESLSLSKSQWWRRSCLRMMDRPTCWEQWRENRFRTVHQDGCKKPYSEVDQPFWIIGVRLKIVGDSDPKTQSFDALDVLEKAVEQLDKKKAMNNFGCERRSLRDWLHYFQTKDTIEFLVEDKGGAYVLWTYEDAILKYRLSADAGADLYNAMKQCDDNSRSDAKPPKVNIGQFLWPTQADTRECDPRSVDSRTSPARPCYLKRYNAKNGRQFILGCATRHVEKENDNTASQPTTSNAADAQP